jgi:DNA polymerase-3 subunit epsilon
LLYDFFKRKVGCDSYEEYVKIIDKNYHTILDEFNLFYVALTRTKSSAIIEDYNLVYLEKKNWKKILNDNIEQLGERKMTFKATSAIIKKTKITEENCYSKQKNSDKNMIVLDFETNSDNPKDVLEVGALKICKDGNKYVVLDTFHRYYHSKYDANPFAIEVHKLSPAKIEKLRKGVNYAKYFADDYDFVNFCQGCSTLIAHNITFELKYISDLVSFENLFCTMKENKQIVKTLNVRGYLKNPRLDEVCCFYDIKLDNDSYHSAIYDVTKTLEILNKMNNSSNEYDIIKHTFKERIKTLDELKFIQQQKEQKKIQKEEIKKENKQKNEHQKEKFLFWNDLSCPHCFSFDFTMKGKRKNLNSFTQRFQCNKCVKIFTKRIDEEGRPIEKIIPLSSKPIDINLKKDSTIQSVTLEIEKNRLQHNSITASEIYEKSKHINRTQQFSEVIIESSNEDLYLRRNKNDDLKIAEIPSQTIQKRFSKNHTYPFYL